MIERIYGICPVCDEKVMRVGGEHTAHFFGPHTVIHFACLGTWNRVIGAWHAELAVLPAPIESEDGSTRVSPAVVTDLALRVAALEEARQARSEVFETK